MSDEAATLKLPGTPKPWMNASVATMLKTPGLRSVFGKMFIILTVTGAKTGTSYATPVEYVRDGDRLIVLSQRTRRWWKNIAAEPEVEIFLKGEAIRTIAHVADGDEARDAIAVSLRLNPRTAKFYGIAVDEDGEPEAGGVDQLHEAFAVILIDHPVEPHGDGIETGEAQQVGHEERRVPSAGRTLVIVMSQIVGIVALVVLWSVLRRRRSSD